MQKRKTLLQFLLVVLFFSSANAFALPPRQHLAKGTVVAIEREQISVVPSRLETSEPTTFATQEGRTRFRADGHKAARERPPVGQRVRLYYREEMGVWVATEIAWEAGEPPKK